MLNQPIKVMAIFNVDGKIEPVKFRFDDKVVKVEKILKTYDEKTVWYNRLVFVCLHNGKSIFELKYEISTNLWYLSEK